MGIGNDYRGVKGWLLFLCVNLTMLDPMGGFINLMVVTETVRPQFEQNPGLHRLILIGGTCNIALIVYSIYAGTALWRIAHHAVRTAKRYFAATFLYTIFSMILPFLVGLPEETRNEVLKMAPLNSLIVFAYIGIWYRYLDRSRRVRATYGDSVG